jgi:hypothetical protein
MADEPKTPIDDQDDELLLEDQDALQPEEDGEPPEVNDEGEDVLTFGDDIDEKDDDTNLVRHLRQQIKDRDKRLAEAARAAPQSKPVEVGPKPTLADCEYDEEKFEREYEAWKERKSAADSQQTNVQQQTHEQERIWSQRLGQALEQKAALGKADADDAFENVRAALGEERASAIIYMAEDGNAAKLMYALGTHPTKLAELAAQQDPIRFVKDVAKLEGQLKMVKRKSPPDPDVPERGSARISRETTDKKLAKLEEEAARTGDRTAVARYKKSLKKTAK